MSPETENKNSTEETEKTVNEKSASSTGLEPNIGGVVAYLLGALSGIILFVMEKENDFIRFHALQSVIALGGLTVCAMILSIIPFLGWIIVLLSVPLYMVLWIFLMYKAYQGERYKLMFVGDIVEQQLNKGKSEEI
ncbi:hypothetical protein QA612_00900 [Evansella sp. AB-P1]|uniref:DUF4870 domain-containing protein n=1 Tax=Evansella sp. AB-P1 TaxID=3037653 RepID=UPI00241DEE23|nr:DUF4870 domain-containing protein [Evansella sp. AB-P1]MDG5786028.1 hypothetical protein [Evansella sp. AB-P1]